MLTFCVFHFKKKQKYIFEKYINTCKGTAIKAVQLSCKHLPEGRIKLDISSAQIAKKPSKKCVEIKENITTKILLDI